MRRNPQSRGGGGGLFGRLIGAWRQPSVRRSEDAGSEVAQLGVPWGRIRGMMICATLVLLMAWLSYHAWSSSGFLWGVSMILLSVVRIVSVGVIVGAGFGCYWWGREIINEYPLTGFDRVLGNLVKQYGKEILLAELGVTQQAAVAEEVVVTWEIEVKTRGGFKTLIFDPKKLKESDLALFCAHVLEVGIQADVTHAKWGEAMSRTAYDELTQQMLKVGGMKKSGPARNSPLQLTRYGLNLLRTWDEAHKKDLARL